MVVVPQRSPSGVPEWAPANLPAHARGSAVAVGPQSRARRGSGLRHYPDNIGLNGEIHVVPL